MESVKIQVDKTKVEIIREYYKADILPKKIGSYEYFKHETKNKIQVIAYSTKNPDVFTVLFKGNKDVENEANLFSNEIVNVNNSNPQWLSVNQQIGSDEVGKGDFFGPIVVVGTFLTAEDIDLVNSLNIKDSKRLTDQKMITLSTKIKNIIKHQEYILSAEDLSNYIFKGTSYNQIIATLHNTVHKKLIEKYHIDQSTPVFIDQFEVGYKYKQDNKTLIKNPIIFQTKGETYYPSIATSSVLARYYFLKYWKEMEIACKVDSIPKGAGSNVDIFFQEQINNGNHKLLKYAKRFFRNYKESDKIKLF